MLQGAGDAVGKSINGWCSARCKAETPQEKPKAGCEGDEKGALFRFTVSCAFMAIPLRKAFIYIYTGASENLGLEVDELQSFTNFTKAPVIRQKFIQNSAFR